MPHDFDIPIGLDVLDEHPVLVQLYQLLKARLQVILDRLKQLRGLQQRVRVEGVLAHASVVTNEGIVGSYKAVGDKNELTCGVGGVRDLLEEDLEIGQDIEVLDEHLVFNKVDGKVTRRDTQQKDEGEPGNLREKVYMG